MDEIFQPPLAPAMTPEDDRWVPKGRAMHGHGKKLAVSLAFGGLVASFCFLLTAFGFREAVLVATWIGLLALPGVDVIVGAADAVFPDLKTMVNTRAGIEIFTGVVFFLLVLLLVQVGWARRLLHYRLWPDRPFFFDAPGAALTALADRGAALSATDPRRRNLPFVGRAEDLAWLDGFAAAEGRFCWASLYGPPGRGKTRLALEWCRSLERKGWDASLLDDETDLSELQHWVPAQYGARRR
jgi:hypothetical protein